MDALFHIVDRSVWQNAVDRGVYSAESLGSEGFIHCSFASQVAGVANARYRDVEGLCVVELDPARLAAHVVVEDSYGSGTAYPHVYGSIHPTAAVRVHELPRDTGGDYWFSASGAAGAASSDR
ncbi:MAG: hypothetical protein QOG22_2591 [Pseudonocardiales bacterium]|jgi:uncharacterized protein (DUF952 family)|nr:hypothetical protein [Pseudonocardiales bacterium]